jgi:hypothetical protein
LLRRMSLLSLFSTHTNRHAAPISCINHPDYRHTFPNVVKRTPGLISAWSHRRRRRTKKKRKRQKITPFRCLLPPVDDLNGVEHGFSLSRKHHQSPLASTSVFESAPR